MNKSQIVLALSGIDSKPAARIAQNTLHRVSMKDACTHPVAYNHVFSHDLRQDDGTALSQQKSGFCWAFAGLGTIRKALSDKLEVKIKDLRLSLAYVVFYDKVERANYFLDTIVSVTDERVRSHLLSDRLMEDGGTWHMFQNIVTKYGIVPEHMMPETAQLRNTRSMNCALRSVLRKFYASSLAGENADKCRRRASVHVLRILHACLGTPPSDAANMSFRTKDGEYENVYMTPLQLADHSNLDECVVLTHVPCHSMDRGYTVQHQINVSDGRRGVYYNVPVDVLKDAAAAQIRRGVPVWFVCDMNDVSDLRKDRGILHEDVSAMDELLRIDTDMSKRDRLQVYDSVPNHAMLLVGYDEAACKWKVENSWGDKQGKSGFLVMSDGWFDEYVYEIVCPGYYLPRMDSYQVCVLPPWDVLGTAAD